MLNHTELLNLSAFSSQEDNKTKDKKGELIVVTVHATWLQIIQELVWTFFSSLRGSILYKACLISFFSFSHVVINCFRLIGKYLEIDSPFHKEWEKRNHYHNCLKIFTHKTLLNTQNLDFNLFQSRL